MSLIIGEKENVLKLNRVPRNEAWEREFKDVPNKDYHSWPEISSSNMKERLKSAAHFKEQYRKENEAFDLGTAAHALNLENDLSAFVVMPAFEPKEIEVPGKRPGTTKKEKISKKSQEDDWSSRHQGQVIVPAESYEHLLGMNKVFLANERVKEIMKAAEVERSFKYLDEQTGLACCFRTDILKRHEGVIYDYKTAESARQFEFEKAIARYGYHLSAAHYLVGAQRVISPEIKKFVFVVQEKKPPYAINIVPMSKRDIERSIEMRAKVMRAIKEDMEKGVFPDYTKEIKETSLPNYAFEFTA